MADETGTSGFVVRMRAGAGARSRSSPDGLAESMLLLQSCESRCCLPLHQQFWCILGFGRLHRRRLGGNAWQIRILRT